MALGNWTGAHERLKQDPCLSSCAEVTQHRSFWKDRDWKAIGLTGLKEAGREMTGNELSDKDRPRPGTTVRPHHRQVHPVLGWEHRHCLWVTHPRGKAISSS